MTPQLRLTQILFTGFLTAALPLGGCADPSRTPAEPVLIERSGEPEAVEETEKAVASGRVEILTSERKFTRRSGGGDTELEAGISIPQFLGDGPGIERINGFLRHLVLHWPDLVPEQVWENERPVEAMRQLAATLSELDPEDWPPLSDIYDAPLLKANLIELSDLSNHELATLEVTIPRLGDDEVTLRLSIHGVAAISHYHVGELTIDLATGKAVRVP